MEQRRIGSSEGRSWRPPSRRGGPKGPAVLGGHCFGPRLWIRTVTLEFNRDLGRQIVPVVMKILDNFVFNVPVLRFQHRTQKVAPHGMVRAPHASGGRCYF